MLLGCELKLSSSWLMLPSVDDIKLFLLFKFNVLDFVSDERKKNKIVCFNFNHEFDSGLVYKVMYSTSCRYLLSSRGKGMNGTAQYILALSEASTVLTFKLHSAITDNSGPLAFIALPCWNLTHCHTGVGSTSEISSCVSKA